MEKYTTKTKKEHPPDNIIYDFSPLDNDNEFQKFLNLKSQIGEPDEFNLEKCKEGVRLFTKHFLLR